MEKTSSKKILLYIISFVVLIGIVFSIAYAFFNYSRLSTTSESLTSGTIGMGYSEGEESLYTTIVSPINDDDALDEEINSFDFNVNYTVNGNAQITYGIYIENISSQLEDIINEEFSEVEHNYLKFALKDVDNDEIVVEPIYYSDILKNESIENGGNLLYTKSVTGTGTDNYRILMWVSNVDDENNEITMEDIDKKTFSFIVNVKAMASVN